MKKLFPASVLLALFLSLLAGVSAAQDTTYKHPIDIWYQQALEKDDSTTGYSQAAAEASEMWDTEMSVSYARLMNELAPKQKTVLLNAQRAWLKYRDAQRDELRYILLAKEGTAYRIVASEQYMNVVRARALQLGNYEYGLQPQ